MKKEELYETIEGIDEKFIDEAERIQLKRKQPVWFKWVSIAACLCLVLGLVTITSKQNTKDGNHVLVWDTSFAPGQYFTYSNLETNNTDMLGSIAETPYAESVDFSNDRLLFEEKNFIPIMDKQYDFTATANYNSDGSLYSIELVWHQNEEYSNLTVTAGYEEIKQIKECMDVEIDRNGNIVEPGITVTVRDGVQIVAVGNEDGKKSITFQNESGWYQITGSWNDDYEPVVELLDWFWMHPIDFSDF